MLLRLVNGSSSLELSPLFSTARELGVAKSGREFKSVFAISRELATCEPSTNTRAEHNKRLTDPGKVGDVHALANADMRKLQPSVSCSYQQSPSKQLNPKGPDTRIEDLLGRHYVGSLRLARSILRDESEAADAVQGAYGSAIRHFSSFREESSFGTWINRIVVNQCLMRLRQLRRAPAVSIDALAVEPNRPMFAGSRLPGPEEIFEQREMRAALDVALNRLPETLRCAWLLHEHDGLSMRDLSEALGISVAAAKSRLFRARAELRRILRGLLGRSLAPQVVAGVQ